MEGKPPIHTLLSGWLRDLQRGASRLPPETTAEAFSALLAVLLDPPHPARTDGFFHVCVQCSLSRPASESVKIADLKRNPAWDGLSQRGYYLQPPELMPACPHCHEAEWAWSSTSGRTPQPWHALPGAMPRDS